MSNTLKVLGIGCSLIFAIIFICAILTLLLYILGLGRSLGPIDPLSGGNTSFTVINNSGYDICNVHIKTASSYPKVSGNKLKNGSLGNSRSYVIDNIPAGRYDLLAERCDKVKTYIVMDVNLNGSYYTWNIGQDLDY